MTYGPDQLLQVALELPDWERDEICRRLGERSAVIRCVSRWSGWFVPMFVTGTLAVLGGVLVAVLGGPFWLAAILLLAGVTVAGVPAIKIWQVTWQVLDIAVAATILEVGRMAMLVYLHKEEETPAAIRYRFHTDGGSDRYLVLDKQAETIQPEDGNADGVFRAAAGKLARAWFGSGEAPERLIHQA